MSDAPLAPEVLATLNADGTRRWVRPRLSRGRFLTARRAIGYALIVLFVALPFVRVGGRPAVLIDLEARELSFFGALLLPTDTVLLMLMLLSIFVGIFLLTALFGRAWCGWGCPQTVYLELVFRPIERFFEGSSAAQRRLDRAGGLDPRRIAKWVTFAALAVVLGNVFLSYFVGTERIFAWVQRSPLEHPAPFAVMAITSALVFADFAFFREQMCSVACPYARLQSALLDPQSLIIAYDASRGEPRARARVRGDATQSFGDCIDCNACVSTCPTGIDIRRGLQLECIACAQCVDACDAIMTDLGKPLGLVRYGSQAELGGGEQRLMRPRVIAYAGVFALAVAGLVSLSLARRSADVTLLRPTGLPFVMRPDGSSLATLSIKIENHEDRARRFEAHLLDTAGLTLLAPALPLVVPPLTHRTVGVFLVASPSALAGGERDVRVAVTDADGFSAEITHRLMGANSARTAP